MNTELKEKVVLVTGGGRGLGAAIATELAEAGANVFVADLSERAESVAASLTRDGARVYALRGDVGNEDDARGFVDAAKKRFGRLDAIINNAGIDRTTGVDELAIADWDAIIRTNLRGPFLLSKLALPMLRESRGDIVNIASTAAKRGWANASAYHASKWGLLGLSHALHAEFRAHQVRVTAVIAGGMRTPFLLERFPDLDPAKLQDPRDVARAVRFALTQPRESVVAEITVLPVQETSWP
ncbi:MAG TPA: SDR family oxidoreductase [Casimicrobiaceae bacterium]|nr:SDR family oxidoreductase [Casimicrobiaceae bacterium]